MYYPISEEDENVRKNAVCQAVSFSEDFYSTRLSHISTYTRLIRVVARIWKWASCFKSKARIARDDLSVSDLEEAKTRVVRLVQSPVHLLLNSPSIMQHSPMVDDQGIIRVGGRLSRMSDSVDFKHPIILPKTCLFSSLVVQYSHIAVMVVKASPSIMCVNPDFSF